MWCLVAVMILSVATAEESACGPMSSIFLDPGDTHHIFHPMPYAVVQLNAYYMPYNVFDVKGSVTGTIWHRSGSVELQTLSGRAQGLLVHIASTDWANLTDLTGTIYSKHTTNATDLDRINGHVCGEFHAEEALIITFDCLRQDDAEDSPKVRYQLTLAVGHDSSGQNRSYLLIATDVLPGDAWDYLTSAPYRYYLYYLSDYFPIPVTANSVLAIDVTSKQGFTPNVQPNVITSPCKVTCSVTRAGVLTDFSGHKSQLADEKIILAEWKPAQNDCRFKFISSFKTGYFWTSLAVGSRPMTAKYYRFIDFNKNEGEVSLRGVKCKSSCQNEPSSFPYDVRRPDDNATYATIEELEAGVVYAVEARLCTGAGEPGYRLTYNFSAVDDQPLAVLQIDRYFYTVNDDQISGPCRGGGQ